MKLFLIFLALMIAISGADAKYSPALEMASGANITFNGGFINGLDLPIVTVGSADGNKFKTDGTNDEVELLAAYTYLDNFPNNAGVVLITSMLQCSQAINFTTPDSGTIELWGIGKGSGIMVPEGSNGIIATADSFRGIRDLTISGPNLTNIGGIGVLQTTHYIPEMERVDISYFDLGVQATIVESYEVNIRNCVFKTNHGINLTGMQNSIENCVFGYEIPAGTRTGTGIEIYGPYMAGGNSVIGCDTGNHAIGIVLKGYDSYLAGNWHDDSSVIAIDFSNESTYTARYNTVIKQRGGGQLHFDSGAKCNTVIDPGLSNTILLDVGANSNYFKLQSVDYSSSVVDHGTNNGFVAANIQYAGSPHGSLSGSKGQITTNKNAASGQPMGYICTTTGSAATAVWTALPNIP